MGNASVVWSSYCGGKAPSDRSNTTPHTPEDCVDPRSVTTSVVPSRIQDPMMAEGVSSLEAAPKPTGPPEPLDWRSFCEGCTSCVIFCHGGCPDGLASAILVQRALSAPATSIKNENFDIVQLYHVDRAKIAADKIESRTAALYVDITPYEEDLPVLRQARVAAVIDHHKSVAERMDGLRANMKTLRDLSYVADNHSAASLVSVQMRSLLEDKITDFDKKIAILRKKDVWDYKIAKEWAADAELFRAFIGKGTDTTLTMMETFLDDLPSVLEKGQAAVQVQIDAAAALVKTIIIIGEEDRLKVGTLELKDGTPYDSKHLLKLCTNLEISILLVVPHDVQRGKGEDGTDVVNIIIKRTDEKIAGDVGGYAKELFESEKGHGKEAVYLGGGGHPFAAGLQVNHKHLNVESHGHDIFQLAVKRWRELADKM